MKLFTKAPKILAETQTPTTLNDVLTPKLWKLKWFKVSSIILIMLALVVGGLYIAGVGLIIIKVDPKDATVIINSKETKQRIFITKGNKSTSYAVEKAGYITLDDYIPTLKPLTFKTVKFSLIKGSLLTAMNVSTETNSFMQFNSDGKSLVYFSDSENLFFKVNTDKESATIPDNYSEKIAIDMGIKENEQIQNILYSPNGQNALVLISMPEFKTRLLTVNFTNTTKKEWDSSYVSADWYSDAQLLLIKQGKTNQLVIANVDGKTSSVLMDYPNALYVTVSDKKEFAIVETDGDSPQAYLINLAQKSKKLVYDEGMYLMFIKPIPGTNDFSTVGLDDKLKIISAEGKTTVTSIEPYSNSFFWEGSNDVYYLEYKNEASFKHYTVDTKNDETLKNLGLWNNYWSSNWIFANHQLYNASITGLMKLGI